MYPATLDTQAEKFESLERMNSICETNGKFVLTYVTHVNGQGLHESKLPFVSRIAFIRSKLSNFSAQVSGVSDILQALSRAG